MAWDIEQGITNPILGVDVSNKATSELAKAKTGKAEKGDHARVVDTMHRHLDASAPNR